MSRSIAKGLLVLLNILIFIVSIVVLVVTDGSRAALVPVFIVAIVLDVILSRYLRCPSCGRGQGRNWLFAEYCPHCGERLD